MKRHATDVFSLTWGLVFLAIGIAFIISRANVSLTRVGWLWPLPLIGVGALIVARAARRTDKSD